MAKPGDSRLAGHYGGKRKVGDPLGELSDIMGMSGGDGRDGDISLELERELFGVNDDAPATRRRAVENPEDDSPVPTLESELLAVLGGLGAKPPKVVKRSLQPELLEPDVSAPAQKAAEAELEVIDLGDLELSDIDGLVDETATVSLSPAGKADTDSELEALFADVMAPGAVHAAADDDDDSADFGHDPLTLAEPVPVSDDAVAEYEAGEFNRFDDDVEIAQVLALSPVREAAPEPELESVDLTSYETPGEDIGEAVAAVPAPAVDPIADAFSDLADFDLPKFVGTGAGTRAAMAAADAAQAADAVAATELSAADLDIGDIDMAEAAEAETFEAEADLAESEFEAGLAEPEFEEPDYSHELPVEEPVTAAPEEEAYDLSGETEFTYAGEVAGEDSEAETYAPAEEPESEPEAYADEPDLSYARADEFVPEIQTVEVSERIAHTGGFDVPEIEEEQAPLVASGDDFEAEFAESLAEYQQAHPAPQPEPAPAAMIDDDTDFEELFDREFGRNGGLDTAAAGIALGAAGAAAARTMRAGEDAAERAAYDPDLDTPIGIPDAHVAAKSGGGRKGFMIAATLGALAVAGVAFAVGNSFFNKDGGTAETATVIKADPEPVKIKPEETGEAAAPSQQTSVYDQANGAATGKPAQEALVTTAEEPVELPTPDETPPLAQAPAADAPEADVAALEQPAAEAAAKSEDRVLPEAADEASPAPAETALIAPKRVRTMVVKPDGSLVPSETTPAAPSADAAPVAEATPALAPATAETPAATVETAAAPALAPAAEPVGEPAPDAPIPTQRPDDAPAAEIAAAPAEPAPAVAEAPAAPAVEPAAPVAEAEPAAAPVRTVRTQSIRPAAAQETAAGVPVPGERAADQPVNVVGRTGGENQNAETQVATAEPAPADAPLAPAATETALAPAAASGAYTVQIASLPSVEEAQKSFASLSSRYGNLIGGRPMNIQKADIPGKGTFYRIRVTAETKDDAAKLCARIKANGGSCFISK